MKHQRDISASSFAPEAFGEDVEQSLKARRRIVCAECQHCIQFREVAKSGRYILKARCAKGHWKNGSREVTCDLHRITGRSRVYCADYESSSDDDASRDHYLARLDDLLPDEQHIHEPNGSFVDKTETMTWDIHRT